LQKKQIKTTPILDYISNEEYFSYYSNNDYTSGICIFKNENNDVYDNIQDTNVLNNVVHNNGKEYITPDNNYLMMQEYHDLFKVVDELHK